MKSLKARFEREEKRNPFLAAYPCLVSAIQSKKFDDEQIINTFKNLVPKKDYFRADEENLIQYLLTFSADR